MYKLSELFRNSAHDDSAFSQSTISAIESMIYTKNIRGKDVPFIKCIIRGKEIRLAPEEAVRQLYVYTLIHEYGYEPERIKLEHGINFGREVKRADIVIFEKDHPTSEYIIVEVKKPNSREGKAQLKSYCNASGAIMGVWTNGQDFSYYHRKDPNYFEDIPGIPKASEKLRDILRERWTILDLEAKDRLRDGKKSLTALIQEMEDDVLADAGVDVFEEVFKLIYTKLYDEMQSSRDKSRVLEFRNYGDTDSDLKANIQALFKQAMKKWPGVFGENDTISLTPSHLSVCVSALQGVKLFNSNLEVVDDAFEYLMSKSQKGEKGQFFTPRYVIDMCVKMLNPQKHESMIDTAAGSCGFPVHTIFYVWRQILAAKGIEQSHLFTAEEKPLECQDYVRDKVFAIDFDEKTVRVARTLNLIAGDGRTNVLHLNTLDYGRWEETITPRAWQKAYSEGWLRFTDYCAKEGDYSNFMFDIVMANPPFAGDIKEGKIISRYELAKDSKGKYASKIGRDILFIERNIHFLKPGGRMAIILPQGRFNNSSDKYIRDFIASECRILAVIGLHENVFKPHTGTKTSVLLVQKWDDDLCPRREDYPVFFATMRKPGKDNSGEKIYVRDSDGYIVRDAHYHPIVSHDLYNHEGLTEDGIAEAFIEFAKREGLSFFGDARFAEERYRDLVSGLEVSEVMLSDIDLGDRMDAEYFSKSSMAIKRSLQNVKTVKLGDVAYMVASAFYPAATQLYSVGDTPFVRCVDCVNYPVISHDQDATFERIPRTFATENKGISMLIRNEIVITKVGTPCYASIVDYDEVALSRTVMGLKNIRGIDPHYLLMFLRCKYGFGQLMRQREQTIQFQLTLPRVKAVDVFVPSEDFQRTISDMVKEYRAMMRESQSHYTAAQSLLTDSLGHVPQDPRNTATVSFSRAFSAGRLDAEYFMPKYDALFAHLEGCPTIGDVCRIHGANFTPKNGTQYSYIELADVGTSGNITGATVADGSELPTRARRIVHAGQVIVSSIEGSLQSCALVTGEHDGALCSTGFYVIDSDVYNSETLLLLFKSEMIQTLMKRGCSGTILSAISETELRKIPLPPIYHDTQEQISGHVRDSFTLRRESQRLISLAVKSVEAAVESGEDTAMNLITQEENSR
ncbi:MAG: N-6 DNA methylase [Synergistaceae bacterium]|nr:N-6 DNA methylase [Synergistaceae bacterium]